MNAQNFEEMKKRFKQKLDNANKKTTGKKFNNSEIYPFWNMPMDGEVLIRLFKDTNPDNTNEFYIDKYEHTLTINGKERNIVCIEKHFGEKCPICELSRKFYAAKNDKEGLKYYRKKRHLAKALILQDGLPPDEETKETLEGKVKTFRLNKKLVDKIMYQIANELSSDPFDVKDGYNFKIKKSVGDGGNAEYLIGSTFVRDKSAIPQALLDEIGEVKFADLNPVNPTLEKVNRFLNSALYGTEFSEDGTTEETEGEDHHEVAVSGAEVVAPKVVAPTVAEAPAVVVEAPKETAKPSVDAEAQAVFERIMARKTAAK